MAKLFLGLCNEAGIFKNDLISSMAVEEINKQGDFSLKQPLREKSDYQKAFMWFEKLQFIIKNLPNPENPFWSEFERKKWLNALTATYERA